MMTHNFKVGDEVEVITWQPVIDESGEWKQRRNRKTGQLQSVFKDDWSGYSQTVEAIDCGKTKRIKIGGSYYKANRVRHWGSA